LLDRTDSSEESGFALVFVMLLSVVLMTMLIFAVSSSVGNLNTAANFSNVNQAQNTAMSGLSDATNKMATALAVTGLPCSASSAVDPPLLLPTVQNTSATYNVSITYTAAGSSDPCTPGSGPSTTPDAAILVSTGTTAAGTPQVKTVVMREAMTIAATPGSLTAPFTYAMFSSQTLNIEAGLNVNSPSTCIGPNGVVEPSPCANTYGNVVNNCQGNSLIQGSVQVGTALVATLTIGNQCEVKGDIFVAGNVILKNGATVDGSIHAYGGDVTLEDSSSVGGSIYASTIAGPGGGTINIDPNPINQLFCLLLGCDSVDGSLYAANTVTSVIGGVTQTIHNLLPLVQVAGTVNVGYPSGSMPAAPTTQTIPQLNPTALTLSLTAGDSATPTPHDYTVICIGGTNAPGCSSFQPSCSTFQATVTAAFPATQPTAIFAPTCVVTTSGNSTFTLGSNEIWVVGGFSNGGGLTVQASVSGQTHDLGVVVSASLSLCPLADISLNGNTSIFAASVKIALFTPCNVNINGDQTIYGQMLAGENITTKGNVTLNYDQSGSKYLPGAYGSPTPTPTVTGKTVTNG
jgi:Tfp pilus assembly protein PilX